MDLISTAFGVVHALNPSEGLAPRCRTLSRGKRRLTGMGSPHEHMWSVSVRGFRHSFAVPSVARELPIASWLATIRLPASGAS
jgi:hypothetical protein